MSRKERYTKIIQYFSENLPEAETELVFKNPFQLLIAVVLSAQCTDKRVNLITPALFDRFKDPKSLSEASLEEVFSYIKSISYPNNKSKHLIGLGKMLIENFSGIVPSSIENLTQLPGVGRKTANVIASVIFNQPTMAVDTHVFRVSKRIGLANANSKTPLQVELTLYKYLPKEVIPKAHHWLILHGRYICMARKPKCEVCGISDVCKLFQSSLKAKQV